MKISDDMNVSCFSSYSITIYFRYLGNPINDRVQFLRSSENLWSPEKGFISCDNKIGEKQFLFISAPRQDRHLPELLWYEIWGLGAAKHLENSGVLPAAEQNCPCIGDVKIVLGQTLFSFPIWVFWKQMPVVTMTIGKKTTGYSTYNGPPMQRTCIGVQILVIDIKKKHYIFSMFNVSQKLSVFVENFFQICLGNSRGIVRNWSWIKLKRRLYIPAQVEIGFTIKLQC